MGHVYGDSTPFPYDIDFIEVIRAAVHCGVTLLGSYDAMTSAVERSASFEQVRNSERARLERVGEAVRQSMSGYLTGGPERQVRVATRINDSARSIIEGELAAIEAQVREENARMQLAVDQARDEVHRALEVFMRRHDLPETEVSLRMTASDESYGANATLTTPFGLVATFRLDVPHSHAWSRARRVLDLSPGTEVHVPQEAGWISKRVELQPVKLDRYYVCEVHGESHGARVTLRKAFKSGPGYEIEVATGDRPHAVVRELDDAGDVKGDAIELEGDDRDGIFRLWNRILGSVEDLTMRREAMTSARFDGQPLHEHQDPRAIVSRLVGVIAPTAREIGRRSGSPHELVLRRDLVAEGRREELYVKRSELHDRVLTLPPHLRPIFDPFALGPVHRVSLPPKPIEPEEVSAELEVDVDG